MTDKESKYKLIARLMHEADIGILSDVSLIDAVEFRREQYKLNKQEFALVLNILPSHYSEFVSGKRSLPLNARIRAAAIGVSRDALLSKSSRETDPTKEIYLTVKQTQTKAG